MSRQARTILWVAAGVVALVILAGLILPALPPTRYASVERQCCLNCGALREVQEEGPMKGPPETRNEFLSKSKLSAWYAEHFGATCPHDWFRTDIGRHTYRTIFGFRTGDASESGSSRRPSLLSLPPEDETRLNELFRTDKEVCRKFIADELRKGSKLAN